MGAVLAVLAKLVIDFVSNPDGRPWVQLYHRPGFSMISLLLQLWLWLTLRWKVPRGRDHSVTWEDGPEKFGMVPSAKELEEEHAKCLDNTSENAADAVGFCGVNSGGDSLAVRIIRRLGGRGEVLLYLRLANGETYTLPFHPRSDCRITGEKAFATCGLNISCITPFRTWRISFNGIAKNAEDSSLKHLKFSFIWCCTSEPYDNLTDFSKKQFADNLAEAGLTTLYYNLKSFREVHDQYEQWGHFMGTFSIDGSSEKELNLWGIRMRFSGSWKWKENKHLSICGYTQDGLGFHFGIFSLLSSTFQLNFGHISFPNGDMKAIDECNIKLDDMTLEGDHPSEKTVTLYAGGKKYILKMTISPDGWKLYVGSNNETCMEGRLVTFSLNDEVGRGFCEYSFKSVGVKLEPVASSYNTGIYLKEADVPKTAIIPSVIALTDTLCQCSWVAGGKGASLALMESLEGKATVFTVPKGVVITSAAYQHHLKQHPSLSTLVKELEKMNGISDLDAIRGKCESIMSEFQKLPLNANLKQDLRQGLHGVFGDSLSHVRFAVRSSAVGEDSSETSAAGQMETILGVTTLDKMYEAIKKCWASHFSLTSVQYNRQNGQAINNDMAVVIQEMVPAEIAGVAFTCDPASGDPRFITISANYGLGESVVSASCDPDTITLRKRRNHEVKIQSIAVGAKKTKVSMNETGTTVEDVPETNAGECCMTEAQAVHLGNVALFIENAYGDPRDIEWAFVGDQLFLLQARPITTWDLETEYELIHEFDTGLITDREYLSRANTGEVLPGALTPLTLSTVTASFNQENKTVTYALGLPGEKCRRNAAPGLPISQWQIFINLLSVQFETPKPEHELTLVDKATELSIFGRVLEEGPEIRKRCQKRYGKQPFATLLGLYQGTKGLMRKGGDLKKAEEKYRHYHFPTENYDSAAELYQGITENLTEIGQALDALMYVSMSSSFLNSLVLVTLLGKQTEVTGDLYGDLSKLLSNCNNLESADVPQSIEQLAETINSHFNREVFVGMSTEEALEWLQNDQGPAGDKFRQCIMQHGHRCLKEFEMMSRTWGMDPATLVKSLQVILRSPPVKPDGRKKLQHETDVIKGLKSPLSWFSKKLLWYLVQWGRQGVADREKSKSVMIRAVNILRQAYIQLASRMVKEGRLPDATLIFFLTHAEIGKLLATRSARLISKAVRRRKLYKKLDNLRFPEIACGMPRPVNLEPVFPVESTGTILRGTPVCQGIVKGTARVVVNLEEAHTIQANDILVTYSTDIGWTPYFPLLSGIVTEIGGLISHGAVVAREYGIPCVVGLHGASMIFKSGDQVILNGFEGFLQKVEEERPGNDDQ